MFELLYSILIQHFFNSIWCLLSHTNRTLKFYLELLSHQTSPLKIAVLFVKLSLQTMWRHYKTSWHRYQQKESVNGRNAGLAMRLLSS